MICDRQTDRQTDARGKTICLPTLKGGDIINSFFARKLLLINVRCLFYIPKSKPRAKILFKMLFSVERLAQLNGNFMGL